MDMQGMKSWRTKLSYLWLTKMGKWNWTSLVSGAPHNCSLFGSQSFVGHPEMKL